MPLGISGVGSMEDDVKKAASIAKCWVGSGNALNGKIKDVMMQIPPWVIEKCYGVCFLFYLKAGFVWSGGLGTGFVMTKLNRGTPQQRWSAPSAITAGGMGWGAQIGAQKIFQVVFLNTKLAAKTFASTAKATFGGDLGVALGPVGRQGSVRAEAGNKGVAATYSYSFTQGAFAGINLDGTVVGANPEMNRRYYGAESTSPAALLKGEAGLEHWKNSPTLATLYTCLDIALAAPTADTTGGTNPFDNNYGDVPLSSVAGVAGGGWPGASASSSASGWWDGNSSTASVSSFAASAPPPQAQPPRAASQTFGAAHEPSYNERQHARSYRDVHDPYYATESGANAGGGSYNSSRYGVASGGAGAGGGGGNSRYGGTQNPYYAVDSRDSRGGGGSGGSYWEDYFQRYGHPADSHAQTSRSAPPPSQQRHAYGYDDGYNANPYGGRYH